MTFAAWPDISNFHTLRRTLQKYPELLGAHRGVQYKCKVKLHGTNAGVIVKANGQVMAQSRSQVITPGNDNAGFAAWVESRAAEFSATSETISDKVFYGEWCGPGIQKGVAIAQIPERVFAVFAIRYMAGEGNTLVTEPAFIKTMLANVSGVHVIPWYDFKTEIDWEVDPEALTAAIDSINAEVANVEACDPWVKETFGVEGTGEGLVFYPHGRHTGFKDFGNLAFKAKGEKHQVVARTKAVQVDATVAAGLKEFAELVVTEARCEQGCRLANGGELVFEMKNMGIFLKWMATDVVKECQAELEASGLDRKSAAKACGERAREWYMSKNKSL